MQSWQRKRSEMIAKKDWRGRPTKGVLWNICIYLPDRKMFPSSTLEQWWNETAWRWTILPIPIASILQFPSWGWEHEVKSRSSWLQYSDTYSSALLSRSGKLRPALVTQQLKQHFIISLPCHLGLEVILNMWFMALKNVQHGYLQLVKANWRAGVVPETKI